MLPQKEALKEALVPAHEAQRDTFIMHICILSNPHELHNANFKKPTNTKVKVFLGSKITVNGDCRYEIKRHLLLGRKTMTNLDSILKSRDNTLLTKVHRVKAMVFPVVLYGCESCTIKKAEC